MELSQAIANARSLNDLLPIAQEAEEGITFWGYQYIYIPRGNYTGVAHIHALVHRILELSSIGNSISGVRVRIENSETADELARRIDHISTMNEERLKNKNLFTRIICWIRGVFMALLNRYRYPNGFNVERYNSCDCTNMV